MPNSIGQGLPKSGMHVSDRPRRKPAGAVVTPGRQKLCVERVQLMRPKIGEWGLTEGSRNIKPENSAVSLNARPAKATNLAESQPVLEPLAKRPDRGLAAGELVICCQVCHHFFNFEGSGPYLFLA